jgi:hypothetical protein
MTDAVSLERLRGAAAPKNHNARTIAALTANPGCSRRAVMDAAGSDKERLASYVGFPARFGQSQFAITRGNVFEAQLKANGCAELLRLLREVLGLAIPEASYDDLESIEQMDARRARSRQLLTRAAEGDEDAGTLFDHPLLRLEVGGRWVYLEPDLVALQVGGKFYIVEIKSFAVIDGQADGAKVSAAATQSAVYVLAMRRLPAEAGQDPSMVSHDVVLVCPENFSNRPVATLVDVRKKLSVLERQLARMARIDSIVDALSPDLTFDLAVDEAGVPHRSPSWWTGWGRSTRGTRRSAWPPASWRSCAGTRRTQRRRRSASRYARSWAGFRRSRWRCRSRRVRFRRLKTRRRRPRCSGSPPGCARSASDERAHRVGPGVGGDGRGGAADRHRAARAPVFTAVGVRATGPCRGGERAARGARRVFS